MLTRDEINELSERSKNDRAIIVGSEVRQLCNMALASIEPQQPSVPDRARAGEADHVQLAHDLADCFYLSQGFMEAPLFEEIGEDFQRGFFGLANLMEEKLELSRLRRERSDKP